MLLVDAEDDRLLEAVAALLEELGDPLGDQLGALVDDERPVEVRLVVDAVGDLLALAVGLALRRAVALDIDVDVDVDDLVRSEKAVLDALLERVGVDGLAEVVDVRDVLRLLRRCRHADLRRAEKYSRISRQAASSSALPRWHSSTTIRSKKPGENSWKSFCRSSGPVIAW